MNIERPNLEMRATFLGVIIGMAIDLGYKNKTAFIKDIRKCWATIEQKERIRHK